LSSCGRLRTPPAPQGVGRIAGESPGQGAGHQDPASVKPKPPEPKPDKKKNAKPDKPVAAARRKTSEPAEAKSFLAWMEEYLRCLEELSDNVENFSSMPLEPKAYLKSFE
jgi:hypothetical protein